MEILFAYITQSQKYFYRLSTARTFSISSSIHKDTCTKMSSEQDQAEESGEGGSEQFNMTISSLIQRLETTLSPSPTGIEGIDSEDDRVGTIGSLNRDYMTNRQDWYGAALDYWDDTEANVDGMLGGFAQLSPSDLVASKRFLRHLQDNIRPDLRFEVSCECGAGIGRVSKGVFLPLDFARCDIVEVSAELISQSPDYIGDLASRCKFYCTGLQDFVPKPSTYDVIWVQWCIGYLTDMDCVKFLTRMGASLRRGGVIVIKDNACENDAFVLDREDSSVTRSLDYLLALVDIAGLRVVCQKMQGEGGDEDEAFPASIFPVPMMALEPKQNIELSLIHISEPTRRS